MALSVVTTPGQSKAGSDGNKGVLRIPQSFCITRTSLSGCLVSYPGLSLGGGSRPFAEMQSVYSTAPADSARESVFMTKMYWVHPIQDTTCHPQSIEIAERMVQTVKKELKPFSLFDESIEAYLHRLLPSYRTIPHAGRK